MIDWQRHSPILYENPTKTTQTVPMKKMVVKLPIEHSEEVDGDAQKLENYGKMWKNDQEKFLIQV